METEDNTWEIIFIFLLDTYKNKKIPKTNLITLMVISWEIRKIIAFGILEIDKDIAFLYDN